MKNSLQIIGVFFFLLACSCGSNDKLPNNINTKASIPDSFKFSPAGLKVITSFINRKAGTMSTLYGNPLALKAATGLNKALEGGEAFTLVTWKQQPDEHWFGASIPGELETVEVLKTISDGSAIAINYERYEGRALARNPDTLRNNERIKFILGQQPSVMP
jgi:hypothetical protein